MYKFKEGDRVRTKGHSLSGVVDYAGRDGCRIKIDGSGEYLTIDNEYLELEPVAKFAVGNKVKITDQGKVDWKLGEEYAEQTFVVETVYTGSGEARYKLFWDTMTMVLPESALVNALKPKYKVGDTVRWGVLTKPYRVESVEANAMSGEIRYCIIKGEKFVSGAHRQMNVKESELSLADAKYSVGDKVRVTSDAVLHDVKNEFWEGKLAVVDQVILRAGLNQYKIGWENYVCHVAEHEIEPVTRQMEVEARIDEIAEDLVENVAVYTALQKEWAGLVAERRSLRP